MDATADLCDAFGDRARLLNVGLTHHGGIRRFHGEVTTVKVPADFLRVKRALSEAGLNRVLVVDGGGDRGHALMGDRLAEMALTNGWAGVVINGCIRDSAVIADMAFGVLALGTCPRRPAMEGAGETGVPVSIGDIRILPGHWIYVDEDGAIVSETPLQPDPAPES